MTQILKVIFRRETLMPVVALMFASAVSVGLVIARIAWTGNLRNGFLIWNLILAWMPLCFALLARACYERAGERNWPFAVSAGAWLLFFPNAPYIFTDVIHLTYGFERHFWVDLTLILSSALTGLVLGFVSLYQMHTIVTDRFGRILSWLFIAAVASLSGFGIYLGRFVRLNSWDIVVRPDKFFHGLNHWMTNPLADLNTSVFPALFATFLFITYVMLYALTHLPPAQPNRRSPSVQA